MKKFLVLMILLAGVVYMLPLGYEHTASNRTISRLKVWTEMPIDFSTLSSILSEAEITQQLDARWNCGEESSDMGDRSCSAHVRTVNDAPAWLVSLFFENDQLTQIKIDVPVEGHSNLLRTTTAPLGEPRSFTADQNGYPIIGWMLDRGVLTTNDRAYPEGITQFLWLSKQKIVKRLQISSR